VPTAAAHAALELAKVAGEAIDRLASSSAAREVMAEGSVRLTTTSVVCEFILLPLLAKVQARYPALQFDIDVRPQVLDLNRREADMALRIGKPRGGSELLARKLFTVASGVYASPEYAAKVGVVESWSDLRWVGWHAQQSQGPATQWLEATTGHRLPAVRANTLVAQVAAVENSLGAALLPVPIGRVRKLVRIRPSKQLANKTPPLPTDDVWLMTHRELREVPRIRAVWDILVAEAQHQLAR